MTQSTTASGTSVRRLMLYVHFDPDGVVQPYVLHSLRAMRPTCSTIRFVSTARLLASEQAKVDRLVDERTEAENVGFDFTQWKRCLRPSDPDDFDEIVLMNSSVYGPFRDAQWLFDEMRDEPCDAWGVTESLEHDRHIQSYFIVLRRSVLHSDAFRAFWDAVLPYVNKRQVIRSYEIGFTQWLEGNGFVVAALCPWRQLVRYLVAHPERALPISRRISGLKRRILITLAHWLRQVMRMHVFPSNPTVAYPRELLELGVPFLKLEVLRDNPFLLDLAPIRAKVASFGYPAEYMSQPSPRPALPGMATAPAPSCPVCGTSGAVLYAGKRDAFWEAGPSAWNIRRCGASGCGCVWLDPVPLESEIHKAYASYYTHAGAPRRVPYFAPVYGAAKRTLLRAFLFGCQLLRLTQRREKYWLHGLEGESGRLLEAGCGDGSRLADLEKRGWSVEGQDIDPLAVAHARSKGLRVHEGDLEAVSLPEGAFDVILLSHVVEHLHRPVEFLRRCRVLLKPGGRLVLSTPNAESSMHHVYRRHWLSLDPPRHLVVHTRRSLLRLLRESGFDDVSMKTVPLNAELVAFHSRDIKYLGYTDSNSAPRLGRELTPVALQVAAMLFHRVAPGSGEELFAIASRPRVALVPEPPPRNA